MGLQLDEALTHGYRSGLDKKVRVWRLHKTWKGKCRLGMTGVDNLCLGKWVGGGGKLQGCVLVKVHMACLGGLRDRRYERMVVGGCCRCT